MSQYIKESSICKKVLYVSGLSQNITDNELNTIFGKYGTVISINFPESSNKHRRSVYLEYAQEEHAIAARKDLHGLKLHDQRIFVDYAPSNFQNFLTPVEKRTSPKIKDRVIRLDDIKGPSKVDDDKKAIIHDEQLNKFEGCKNLKGINCSSNVSNTTTATAGVAAGNGNFLTNLNIYNGYTINTKSNNNSNSSNNAINTSDNTTTIITTNTTTEKINRDSALIMSNNPTTAINYLNTSSNKYMNTNGVNLATPATGTGSQQQQQLDKPERISTISYTYDPKLAYYDESLRKSSNLQKNQKRFADCGTTTITNLTNEKRESNITNNNTLSLYNITSSSSSDNKTITTDEKNPNFNISQQQQQHHHHMMHIPTTGNNVSKIDTQQQQQQQINHNTLGNIFNNNGEINISSNTTNISILRAFEQYILSQNETTTTATPTNDISNINLHLQNLFHMLCDQFKKKDDDNNIKHIQKSNLINQDHHLNNSHFSIKTNTTTPTNNNNNNAINLGNQGLAQMLSNENGIRTNTTYLESSSNSCNLNNNNNNLHDITNVKLSKNDIQSNHSNHSNNRRNDIKSKSRSRSYSKSSYYHHNRYHSPGKSRNRSKSHHSHRHSSSDRHRSDSRKYKKFKNHISGNIRSRSHSRSSNDTHSHTFSNKSKSKHNIRPFSRSRSRSESKDRYHHHSSSKYSSYKTSSRYRTKSRSRSYGGSGGGNKSDYITNKYGKNNTKNMSFNDRNHDHDRDRDRYRDYDRDKDRDHRREFDRKSDRNKDHHHDYYRDRKSYHNYRSRTRSHIKSSSRNNKKRSISNSLNGNNHQMRNKNYKKGPFKEKTMQKRTNTPNANIYKTKKDFKGKNKFLRPSGKNRDKNRYYDKNSKPTIIGEGDYGPNFITDIKENVQKLLKNDTENALKFIESANKSPFQAYVAKSVDSIIAASTDTNITAAIATASNATNANDKPRDHQRGVDECKDITKPNDINSTIMNQTTENVPKTTIEDYYTKLNNNSQKESNSTCIPPKNTPPLVHYRDNSQPTNHNLEGSSSSSSSNPDITQIVNELPRTWELPTPIKNEPSSINSIKLSYHHNQDHQTNNYRNIGQRTEPIFNHQQQPQQLQQPSQQNSNKLPNKILENQHYHNGKSSSPNAFITDNRNNTRDPLKNLLDPKLLPLNSTIRTNNGYENANTHTKKRDNTIIGNKYPNKIGQNTLDKLDDTNVKIGQIPTINKSNEMFNQKPDSYINTNSIKLNQIHNNELASNSYRQQNIPINNSSITSNSILDTNFNIGNNNRVKKANETNNNTYQNQSENKEYLKDSSLTPKHSEVTDINNNNNNIISQVIKDDINKSNLISDTTKSTILIGNTKSHQKDIPQPPSQPNKNLNINNQNSDKKINTDFIKKNGLEAFVKFCLMGGNINQIKEKVFNAKD